MVGEGLDREPLERDGGRLYRIPVIGHCICSAQLRAATAESLTNTILGWNSVPATRVAMASNSLCPQKTLTWRARESSGKFTGRPLRMRAAPASSVVTAGS